MSDTEIASLKSEVARLNRIITILLDENEALKARIAFPENGDRPPNLKIAITENGKGNTNFGSAFTENGNGNTNLGSSTSENGKGNTNDGSALAENGNGNTTFRSPVSENGNGNTNLGSAIHENGNSHTNVLPPLPENIPLTPGNLSRLYVFLRQQNFGKVRHDSLRNAAALLLHFYNKGGGAYPELKKLTGLSKYGLAKYLRSLKKRGLIERDGWQKFKVTAHGISYLKQAGLGS